MNTPKPSVLELAKQGDLRAIAALMNRPLQAKGIHADVSAIGDVLAVKLESEQTPPQEALVQFVHRGLSNLNIESFNRVHLSGYRAGQSAPDWEQELELHALPDFLETPTPITPPPVGVAESLPVVPPPESGVEPIVAPIDEPATVQPAPNRVESLPLDISPGLAPPPLEALAPELMEPPEAPQLEDYTLVDEMAIADGVASEPETLEERPRQSTPVGLAGILFGAAIALLAAIIAWLAYTRLTQPTNQMAADPNAPASGEVAPSPADGNELPAAESPAPVAANPAPGDTDGPIQGNAIATASPSIAPTPSPTPFVSPAPGTEQAPAAIPGTTSSTQPFRDAVAKATQAANLGQTATTVEQWRQIAQLWQDAATLMGLVPATDPDYPTAQDRVPVYLSNRDLAARKMQELGGQ